MALIDQEALKSHYGEDIEIIEDLIEIFESSAPETIHSLKDAINANDFSQIELHAHTLKGMLANFFALELKEKCFEIEKKGRDQQKVEISEIANIESQLPGVIEELKAL